MHGILTIADASTPRTTRHPPSRRILPLCALLLVSLLLAMPAAYSETPGTDAGTPAKAAAGPLGDLTSYRKIANDTLVLVQKGDMSAAKSRIKDLETAWDDAEENLRKLSPESWTSVDKSIDRALAQVRSGKPDVAACTSALKTLIAKLDTIGKASPK